ncbi:hypothetical protein Tco_0121362 [Tanacetum coccineum]
MIIETIHVKFDELTAMASEHDCLEPELQRFNNHNSSADSMNTPSKEDLDRLFHPMFEENFKKTSSDITINSATQPTQVHEDSSSTSLIFDDAHEAPPVLWSNTSKRADPCKDVKIIYKAHQEGLQFKLGKLVCWSSKKQDCTAMSFAEAEYVSLSACYAQVIWMRTQLLDYGYKYNRIPMYYDSKSAHYMLKKGLCEFTFVGTEYQLADLFTKALPKERFEYLVHRIVIIMAQQQDAADVHPDELCPPNKRYDLMDANKKIDFEHMQCPPESKILTNIIKNHPLRFSIAAYSSVPWIYMAQFWHTLKEDGSKYRLSIGIYNGVKETIKFQDYWSSTAMANVMQNILQMLNNTCHWMGPTAIADNANVVLLVNNIHVRIWQKSQGNGQNWTNSNTRTDRVHKSRELIAKRNAEPNILARGKSPDNKESPEVEITKDKERSEKGKLCKETRNSPIPTPIRSPRIHINLVSSDTEKLQELTDTSHTTSSSSSHHKNLAKTNRLLSLFKTKPTRFKHYKSFFHELQGCYGYLFAHLRARFMPRKSFDTLDIYLHDVMNQVPVYVAEGLILERQKAKEETERLIAKAILQERGNIQAQILTQIENAIANVIPSQVDASVQSYMSGHILHVHPAQSQNLCFQNNNINMKFERNTILQTACRTPAVCPRDQDDPHDDAHLEGENSAKWHKTSEYEAYVSRESSSGQVFQEEQAPSTLGNQEQDDAFDFWTDSYASDDDEIPTKQVSQDIMEEVSLTIDEAKLSGGCTISKKRTKTEAKTTKPDTEWKSGEKTKSSQSPMNVTDEDEEITDEVYELKRREKGKNVEETRNSPILTPIRSPRIHTNLVSSNTEKLQELTDTPHTTSSSSSPYKKLTKTNRLLSLFKTKPTRFKRYKSFFYELQGRYGYLFSHLRARFMPRKSFDTLANNLHDVMVETLPTIVDKHIKKQVLQQVPE